jgi:hypothetical protein
MRDDIPESLFGNANLIVGVGDGELEFDAFRPPLVLHLARYELTPVVRPNSLDEDFLFVSFAMVP